MSETERKIEPQCEATYVDPDTGNTVHCVLRGEHDVHKDARDLEWKDPESGNG